MGECLNKESSSADVSSFLLLRLKTCLSLISIFGILLSTGCNNINQLNRRLASLNLGDDSVVMTGGGAFILSNVLPSQHRAGYYDMIGEGGQFEYFCSTAQPCSCEYTFVHPTQGTRIERVTAADQESDLVRCTSPVPSGIASYQVSVVSGDGNFTSNLIDVALTNGTYAGSTFYIDLSSQDSFVNVKRYQCRKLETVPNPIDGSFIDPLQSDDPKIIYPFNYYTTNVSESLLKAQHINNQEWDCTLTPNKDHTVHWWANPYVYSRSSCATAADPFCNVPAAAELMYPATSLSICTVDTATKSGARGTFSLAKQPYSVFQIPLTAAVAPNRLR